jgi:hemerythrin-like metal-binding protein
MAYFDWADDMVIDGGAIDADHRRLVDLVNALHTATTEGRGREVVEGIMKELLEYTTAHLRREEAQMASVGFPHLERHKIGHDHFVAQLAELQKKYEAGSITVAARLSTVLRDWLSLHIRRSDKELKSYVEKLGR